MIVPGTNLCAREISDSLFTMKDVQLVGAGVDLVAAKNFPFSEFYELPDIVNADIAVLALEKLLESAKVDYLFLAHDQWIYELRQFETIANTKIIKHSTETIQIASFKSNTYERLKRTVRVPKTFSLQEVQKFPLFGKPNRGQGSRGALLIQNYEELSNFVEEFEENYILSEYLPGEEFTVDCFSNTRGKLIFSSARVRATIFKGLAIGTRTLQDSAITEMAESISKELKFVGAWFFQVKLDSFGIPTLIEIGLRIAGASGIQRTRGMNLSAAWLLQVAGYEISTAIGEIQSEVTSRETAKYLKYNREFKNIYIDFDDTLILPNRDLNMSLINVMRAAKESGIKLTLITRHQGELELALSSAGLTELFDDQIWIKDGSTKSSKIEECDGFLFVDDSFREREDVLKAFPNLAICLDQTAFIDFEVQF